MKLSIKILTIFVILIFAIDVYGYGEGSSGISASNVDPYGNIVKYEVREGNLVYNKSIEYSFSSPEFSIYKILVNGKETEYNIPIRIESLRNTSKFAKVAPGIVYRNENVWIGTKRLNYIGVRFKVKNSWMTENGLNDTNYPYLLKWNGTQWLVLKTDLTGKDGIYTYLESPRAGSSYVGIYAISSLQKIGKTINSSSNKIWPTKITEIEEDVKPDIEVIDEKKSPAVGIVISSMILLLIYIYRRGRK